MHALAGEINSRTSYLDRIIEIRRKILGEYSLHEMFLRNLKIDLSRSLIAKGYEQLIEVEMNPDLLEDTIHLSKEASQIVDIDLLIGPDVLEFDTLALQANLSATILEANTRLVTAALYEESFDLANLIEEVEQEIRLLENVSSHNPAAMIDVAATRLVNLMLTDIERDRDAVEVVENILVQLNTNVNILDALSNINSENFWIKTLIASNLTATYAYFYVIDDENKLFDILQSLYAELLVVSGPNSIFHELTTMLTEIKDSRELY